MLPNLTAEEARIIGCLMEKSIFTPDQYPLTLNMLTTACNQKSGRNPVMSLEKFEVQRVARLLDAKHFIRTEENFKSGTEKYLQRLCNTRMSDFQFDSAQFAIICILLLRGPRTPGELRTHSSRLHNFADNAAVVTALNTLMEREGDPLVVKLPRQSGRKDAEYMHLLSGPIDIEAHASQQPRSPKKTGRTDVSELVERVARLEEDVAELKAKLAQSS